MSLQPVQTTAVFLGASYRALQISESAFFNLAPLPLRQLKSGIQQIGVPLLVTGALTRIPGVEGAVFSALHFSGDVLAAGSRAIASQGLSAFGHAVSDNLPSGFGLQTIAHGFGTATRPVLLGMTEGGARVVGQLATATAIGRWTISGGQALVSNVQQKGLRVAIGDTLVNAQGVIARSQAFLQSARFRVSNLIQQGVQVMQQIPQNFGISAAQGLNADMVKAIGSEPLSETYARMESLRETLNASDLSASERIRLSAELEGLKPQLEGQIQAVIASGQYRPPSEEAEVQPAVSRVVEEDDRSVEALRDRTAKVLDRDDPRESLNGEPDVISNRNVPKEEETKGIKGNREAEDYALSVQQMLAQRGINTNRFQIMVNNETVFSMKESKLDQQKISSEQVEAIRTALNDPASLKGSVKISQGSNILLLVQDGRVIMDSLGLTKQAAKVEVNTPQSPGELLYSNASKGVDSQGLRRTQEVAENAFRAGATREQVMEMLKTHDSEYKKVADEKGQDVASEKFGAIVGRSQGKVRMESQPKQEVAPSQVKALQR